MREGAEVDDPVEGVERELGEVLVRLVELISHEGRDQRLDPAGSQRDQEEAEVEARRRLLEQRQAQVPKAVEDRDPEDRAVFPEEAIRQPTAEQREEVHPRHEHVEDVLGLALGLLGREVDEERARQERRQDVPHPVEAEALAALVRDDVGDLARHAPGAVRLHRRDTVSRRHSAVCRRETKAGSPCGPGLRRPRAGPILAVDSAAAIRTPSRSSRVSFAGPPSARDTEVARAQSLRTNTFWNQA
jgi:hypothetical protein